MAEVYKIDFETGDLSQIDDIVPTGPKFTINSSSPLSGSFDMKVDPEAAGTDGNKLSSGFTSAAGVMRFGFEFNLNTLVITGEAIIQPFNLSYASGGNKAIGLEIIEGPKFRLSTEEDDGTNHTVTQSGTLTGRLTVEIEITRASSAVASDGQVKLFINGGSQGTITTLDNFDDYGVMSTGNLSIEGASFIGSGSISGVLNLDNIVLNDDGAVIFAVTGLLDVASSKKPVDINADGDFIYIAGLDSVGFPILLKMASDLAADATLVFSPGLVGTDIGVQCGDFDTGVVWIAGDFGGTNVVEKSENAGTTFVVKDDATFGTVEAFVVGPDSDDRVLISDVTNDDLQETIDSGAIWTQINAAVGFDISAIARLPKNVQESVFGNDSGATNQVDYSVNSGDDMEDITSGMDADDVTGLAVG